MRLVGHLLLACLLLAILKAALAITVIIAGGMLLSGLVLRPRETLRGMVMIAATLVVVGHPGWSAAAVLMLILGARLLEKGHAKSKGP